MKKMGILVLILLSSAGWSAKQANKALKIPSSATYTIQRGDSLSTIAKRYHTSVQAICKLNRIEKSLLLRPGQTLKIPSVPMKQRKKSSSPASSSSSAKKGTSSEIKRLERSYKVEAGDTLSMIAQRFGVRSEEIREANEIAKNSLIRIGQVLKIPSPKKMQSLSSENGSKKKVLKRRSLQTKQALRKEKQKKADVKREAKYRVQRGDTLFSIARKYHSSLEELMRLNGIAPTDIIKPGQELNIPSSTYRALQKKNESAKGKGKKSQKTVLKKIEPLYYTVRHGDTLWKIANRNQLSIKEIRTLNKLSRRHILHAGEKLVIRAGSSKAVSVAASTKKAKKKRGEVQGHKRAKYYTVQHGDSLWKIAKKQKISLAKLREMNQISKGKVLHSGMKLTVGYEEVPAKVASKKKVSMKKKLAKRREIPKKSKTKKSKKRYAKKSANRRINSAMAQLNGKGGAYSSSRSRNTIIRTAKRYLGRRYVWGAEGPSSFDCSGFTQYVLRKSKGVKLPRVSRKQAYYGKYVTRSQLRPGDLIFFDTSHSRRGYVNHVGIYIGNNKFIHASSARHRVVITSLNRPFYRARFKWGRRVN